MIDQALNYDYDQEADVLYISKGHPRPSYSESLFNDYGIMARYDMDTDEFTGVTIINFYQRLKKNDLNLQRLLSNVKSIADQPTETL
jgi:uncharacterized protein YuzE